MAQLWTMELERWAARPLNEATCMLADGRVVLARHGTGQEHWILLAMAHVEVSVNGEPVQLGLRVLRDRDAIHLGGNLRAFFSTESPAQVVPLGPGRSGLNCARCSGPLKEGMMVVACPSCGALHHEDAREESLCWTYDPKCAVATCAQETALSPDDLWTPEEG